jgi:hypothetical protein
MHRLASHGQKPQGFSATASAELEAAGRLSSRPILLDSHPDRCEGGNLFRPRREIGEPPKHSRAATDALSVLSSHCSPKGQIDGELV